MESKFVESIQSKMNVGTWKIRFQSHYLAALFLIALVTSVIYITSDRGTILENENLQGQQQNATNEEQTMTKEEQTTYEEVKIARNDSVMSCNLFSGRWVFDNISYPLYKERECSFMMSDFACETYGRKDSRYQNWRWQPHECDLPRFNGTVLLEKIRGKRLVFVGDSVNKNQWDSMLCLIELSTSSPKLVTLEGNLFTFQATEYNATIEFYWSPLLVESNCDNPVDHRVKERIFRAEAIEKHARHWTDADILIFDSFMWWLEPNMTILWGSLGSSDAIYRKTKMRYRYRRYEMALNTWSDWLEFNINRTKTKLFFMSLSPYHFHGETWDGPEHCYEETEPIFKENYWGIATDREMINIAELTLQKLERRGLQLEYLNITNLSDYRKDAHPSIYRNFFHPPSEEQLADPKSYSDCVHWCLPGVPDVWNEILYSYIINSL